jgi:serine/threonine protein kinase
MLGPRQLAFQEPGRVQRGERPDIEEYARRHPEIAGVLRQVLPALPALGSSTPPTSGGAADSAPLPRELGDFRIIQEVGRGGMGVVYEAEQISLGRRVALKVLPLTATLDPRQLQRFHNEARAAASLHHSHIVPIYAVGCERGVHYFAMQYIAGLTVEALIRQRRAGPGSAGRPEGSPSPPAPEKAVTLQGQATTLRTSEGLDFFRRVAAWGIQAAEALEHAHSLGIVHRDIKPGNLLIDGQGQLWVTDYGLARTGVDTGLTMTGDLLGTLRYMSPEQALARHGLVDHRTDLYSLAATLYELLTGVPVVEGRDRQDILRQIAEDEPRAPRRLQSTIPVDLETVVLRALAKEPRERYATAQELADDLKRFLDDEPVRARRPTLRQRAAKWARRHRPMVRAGMAALVVAVAALAASTVWAWHMKTLTEAALAEKEEQRRLAVAAGAEAEARQQEAELARASEAKRRDEAAQAAAQEKQAKLIAEERRRQAEAAAGMLQSVFHNLDPRAEQQGEPGLKERLLARLDLAAKGLEDKAADPLTRARLQNALGVAFLGLGEIKKALPQLERSLQTSRACLPTGHVDTLATMNNLAFAHQVAGRLDLALPLQEEAVQMQKTAAGPDHPDTLTLMHNLAVMYQEAGKRDLALPLAKQTLEKREAALGADHPDTLASMNTLAKVYHDSGKHQLALDLFKQVLDRRAARLGVDHPDTLAGMDNLASAYHEAGMFDLAIRLHLQALQNRQEKLGPDHPETLSSMNNLGMTYLDAGKLNLAGPLLVETLNKRQVKLGPDHPATLNSMNNLGLAFLGVGRLDQAIPLFQQALQKRRVKLGPDHPDTLTSMHNLAVAYRSAGKLDLALPLFVETLEKRRATLGHDHSHTLLTMNSLGAAYLAAGKLDLALPLFEETLTRSKATRGPDHPTTLTVMHNLARAYHTAGKLDLAVALLE